MVSTKIFTLAALATVAFAAPKCKPAPTVPLQGATTPLPAPPPTATLKKIAIGHGIQNYTCVAGTSSPGPTASATGALAVLYDATKLYPGTPRTGMKKADFDALTTTTIYGQDIPLNLTENGPAYVANAASPWIAPADLILGDFPAIPFLGHHYFDIDGIPMFDLSTVGLKASVTKNESTAPPANADSGPLKTGAVLWLQLKDSNRGRSVGLDYVYRVVTAGGNALPCQNVGDKHSVPYTAFYWFYKFF